MMLTLLGKSWIKLALALLLVSQSTLPAMAKGKDRSICEDDLTTSTGLRWGGSKKLPFKRVVDIRECLVGTPLGKVTAGRHGKAQAIQINELFGGKQPFPGERYYISLWGSKIEGCFVEMIVQDAPKSGQVDVKTIVPKQLDLGIGSQIIQLPAQVSDATKLFEASYTYSRTGSKIDSSSTWYMTRNIFLIDSQILSFLRNAPEGAVKARITFADNTTQLLDIKPETVKSWDEAFGFNPTCESPDAAPATEEADTVES